MFAMLLFDEWSVFVRAPTPATRPADRPRAQRARLTAYRNLNVTPDRKRGLETLKRRVNQRYRGRLHEVRA